MGELSLDKDLDIGVERGGGAVKGDWTTGDGIADSIVLRFIEG